MKYKMKVTRLLPQETIVEVEADSEEEAHDKAQGEALMSGDWEVSGNSQDVNTEIVETIESDESEESDSREDEEWHNSWESHEFGG